MSLGGKNEGNNTFLTKCLTYRKGVTSADSGPGDAGIPDIRLDIDSDSLVQEKGVADKWSRNSHGHNGILVLAIKPTTSITVQLWVYESNDDPDRLIGDPAAAAGDNSGWFFVAEYGSFTQNTLVTIKDLPSRKYRVVVSAVSGAATILERHTE